MHIFEWDRKKSAYLTEYLNNYWTNITPSLTLRPIAKGVLGVNPPPEKPPQKILSLDLAVLADINH